MPPPRKNLPPVFVISLARATQRREDIARRLNEAQVSREVVEAVDGKALNMQALGKRLRQDKAKMLFGMELLPGEIGCFLSHYNLWERIANQKIDCALVLEDDVDFADDFFDTVADIVASPWHWEAVNLATTKTMPIKKPLELVGNGRKFGLSGVSGGNAAAYLIRPSAAKKMLRYCWEIREPIDTLYVRWWRYNAVYYYVSPPAAIQQKTNHPSAIGERGSVKQSPLVCRVTSSLRRKSERILRKWAVARHRPQRARNAPPQNT